MFSFRTCSGRGVIGHRETAIKTSGIGGVSGRIFSQLSGKSCFHSVLCCHLLDYGMENVFSMQKSLCHLFPTVLVY